MKIQILSDVHLEHADKSFDELVSPVGDVLCLLGNIGSPLLSSYWDFIGRCSAVFKYVILVSGCHEYYNVNTVLLPLSITEIDSLMLSACQKLPNVFYLNNTTITIEGVQFIGSTLFSWIPADSMKLAMEYLNEYKLVFHNGGILTPDVTNHMFLENVMFLEKAVKDGQRQNLKNVVLTHHAPSSQGTLHARFLNLFTQYAMSSPLDEFLDPSKVAAWCCGKTHFNFRQVRNSGSLLVSNQYGYDKTTVIEGFQKDFHFCIADGHTWLRL